MGFETQEEAEQWAENLELARKRMSEERLLNPKLNAWLRLAELPAHKELTPAQLELEKAVFDYAWEAALKAYPRTSR
jgi:hypothetical protein